MGHTIVTILSGMGLLIFAYLLFSNGSAATGLMNAGFSGGNQTIKTLQGR